ncbi:MAG TPA: hypothetical protein VGC92_05590 [Phenylobacterium sp.]|jgi:hypothetical protein
MLILLVCGLLAVMGLWPETPAGRVLHRWLVEAPARKLRPTLVLFVFAVLIVSVAAIAVAKADGFVLAAQGAEAISWFVTFDVATWIDVLAVGWLLAATVRLKTLGQAAASLARRGVRALGMRFGSRARGRRTPRTGRRRTPPPLDDGRGWAGLALA